MLVVCLLVFVFGIQFAFAVDCSIHGKPDYKKADCRHLGLRAVPQYLDPDIRTIDLTKNRITSINGFAFMKYKYLEEIIIDRNELKILNADAFVGMSNLNRLSMFDNSLDISTAYMNDVFNPLENLSRLNIGRNMKTENDKEIFYSLPIEKLSNLRSLIIDLVRRPIFSKQFKELVNLEYLQFDYCRIGYLGNDTFGNLSGSVKELHMTNCKEFFTVALNALQHFPSLSVLNLVYTNIHIIQAFRMLYPFQNKTMDKILLRHVSFGFTEKFDNEVVLTNEMMRYISTICIKTLDISNNRIVSVKNKSLLSFQFPKCFENLYLSANRFEVDEFAVDFFKYIRSMSNLKVFDMSYIPIQFKDPSYINCQIYGKNGTIIGKHCYEHEYDAELKNSMSVVNVTLPSNLIYIRTTHILAKQLIDKITLTNSSLRYLDMSYYMAGKFPTFTVEGYNNLTVLNISGINADMTLPKLPVLQNLKELKIVQAHIHRVIRMNDSIFAWAPNLEQLDLSYNSIWNVKEESFGSLHCLRYLNLSHNMLQHVPEMLFQYKNITDLDLSFNLITMIQRSVRDWIDHQQERFGVFHLYLRKNAFVCTCESTQFLRWVELPVTKAVLDRDYICLLSGEPYSMSKAFVHFHENFMKCNNTLLLQIGISLLVSVIFIIVLITVVYNLRWKIVFFFHRKFRRFVEKSMKVDFKYDIYVSYSDDSASFVKHVLQPQIEGAWGLTMCCEDRDFAVGQSHVDIRAMSIHQSRHIIFIVTPTFSENQWSGFEIERAKYEKFSKDLQRIIVVIKDMSLDKIPFQFSAIWKDVCLIEWPNDQENLHLTWQKCRLWLF